MWLDASQFSKAATVTRGKGSVEELLCRVEQRFGKNAVAVHRVPHVKGNLCTEQHHQSIHIELVTINDVRSALKMSRRDNRFMVGDCVVKLTGGWAMGASLIEPCTMCDLNDKVWQCASSDARSRRYGWTVGHVTLPFEQVVAGALHVDDLAVFSKVWCQRCLAKKVKRTFPDDVGFDVEGEGPTWKILSLIVDIDIHSNIRFFPNNPHKWFGLGLENGQKILQMGWFYSSRVQRYKDFASYLTGQPLMYDRLVAGEIEDMFMHMCVCIAE